MRWASFRLSRASYIITFARRLQRDRHLLDRAPAQGVPLPLRGKKPQLLLLVLAEVVAVPETAQKSVRVLVGEADRAMNQSSAALYSTRI